MSTQAISIVMLIALAHGFPAFGQSIVVGPVQVVPHWNEPQYSSTAAEGYLRGRAALGRAHASNQIAQEQARLIRLSADKQLMENNAQLAKLNEQKRQLAAARYEANIAVSKARNDRRSIAELQKLRAARPTWNRTAGGSLEVPVMLAHEKFAKEVEQLSDHLSALERATLLERTCPAQLVEQTCDSLMSQIADKANSVTPIEYSTAWVYLDRIRTYARATRIDLVTVGAATPSLAQSKQ